MRTFCSAALLLALGMVLGCGAGATSPTKKADIPTTATQQSGVESINPGPPQDKPAEKPK